MDRLGTCGDSRAHARGSCPTAPAGSQTGELRIHPGERRQLLLRDLWSRSPVTAAARRPRLYRHVQSHPAAAHQGTPGRRGRSPGPWPDGIGDRPINLIDIGNDLATVVKKLGYDTL